MGEENRSSATNSLMSCDLRSAVEELQDSSFSADVDSLRENNCALTALENLEHYWFWDNIFNFRTGPGPALCGSSSCFITNSMMVRSCPNLEASSSPFRSIEMVSPNLDASLHLSTDSKIWSSREHHDHDHDDHDAAEESKTAKMPTSITTVSQPPQSVPRFPKLETIPSHKQLQEQKPEVGIQKTKVRRRPRQRATRSMTDLEVDEVQGFIDLGFKFNMDDLNPHVVSMLPGLQRLGGLEKTQRHSQPPSRPYLSEAWYIRRSDSPLLNWRMSSLHEEGVDMKKQLKFWARAVASTVQQES